MKARYLHLAASRLERLSRHATEILCQPEWIHLGEPTIDWNAEILEQFSFGCWLNGFRLWMASIYRKTFPRYSAAELEKLYAACTFREFYFKVGDRLDFEDATFDFIVSEHFFEHLYLPDAVALLTECRRILKPGGVIRSCVPDADLRSYAPPEKPGYPSPRVSWAHHQKHKSRWSVYSFSETLRIAGLQAIPVQYCTSDGRYHDDLPQISADSIQENHPASELLGSTTYFRRLPSLIIDGKKMDNCVSA